MSRKSSSIRSARVVDKRLVIDGVKGCPEHLKSIRVPPAWTDVHVNIDPEAKVMVSGFDTKGREQRIYSSMHRLHSDEKKFRKIRKMIERRDEIGKSIGDDCDGEENEAAIVAYLIFDTGIRPGSEKDTGGDKRAFGATTLQARHVKVMSSGAVYVSFPGKKGVVNHIKVNDKLLAIELKQRKEAAGSAYSTPIFNVTDSELRKYVSDKSGGEWTPKDLRTLRANQIASEMLSGRRVPAKVTKRKKLVREVVKKVAQLMGHTPAICRGSYLDPKLFERFQLN